MTPRLSALSVHLLTATGAVLSMLAMLAAVDGKWSLMFLWLVVALVVASGDGDDTIDPHNFIGRVGVAARVHERINLPGDTVQITLQGLRRITIDAIDQVNPFAIAQIQGAKETPAASQRPQSRQEDRRPPRQIFSDFFAFTSARTLARSAFGSGTRPRSAR
jgi:ATP-dependent Lon protease